MRLTPSELSIRIALVAAIACGATGGSSADVIVLKNGNEVHGEILAENSRRIVVRFPGGTLEIQRKRIERIERQNRGQYLLEEADKCLQRGDYAEAIAAYRSVLDREPTSEPAAAGLFAARRYQASYLRDIGRLTESRALLDELSRDPSTDPSRQQAVIAERKTLDEIVTARRRDERRAVADLEAGNVEGAIVRLGRLYDQGRDRRSEIGGHLAAAYVQRGDRALAGSDWKRAIESYQAAASIEPELAATIRTRYVHAAIPSLTPLASDGKFAELHAEARRALDIAPGDRRLRYFLALGLEGLGEERTAAEEYLAISGARRPRDLVAAVRDLRRGAERALAGARPAERAGESVEKGRYRSRRFEISHRAPLASVRELADVAEQAYREIFRRLGCTTHPRVRIGIDLYTTRAEYLRADGNVAWAGGSHEVVRRLGSLSENRIVCYLEQDGLLTEILPHEIAHALLQHRLGYPRALPLWLNEGFAVWCEPEFSQRRFRRIAQQALRERSLLRVERILAAETYPGGRINLFYAQSASLVEYLVARRGTATWLRFSESLSEPAADVEAALEKHYGIGSAAALGNLWVAWFERKLKEAEGS